MKFHTALASLGLAFSLIGNSQAEPPAEKPGSIWESHSLSGLKILAVSQGFSATQVEGIKGYLADERLMIDLFANHGLLDDKALQAKTKEILDVTQAKIALALTPEQVVYWHDWMSPLRERKVIHRQHAN